MPTLSRSYTQGVAMREVSYYLIRQVEGTMAPVDRTLTTSVSGCAMLCVSDGGCQEFAMQPSETGMSKTCVLSGLPSDIPAGSWFVYGGELFI